MRVLIIDDSTLMRRIVGTALREAELPLDEVSEAGDGADGIAALQRLIACGESPDLVLCDVHMPVMDGISFLRARAALGVTVPVLMVTADAGDPLVAAALSAGARGFIAKPFSAEQVREQLLAVMERA